MINIALAKYEAGVPLMDAEEELALLLPDELDTVSDLIAKLERQSDTAEQPSRLWLFLALAWLLEHRASFEDPLQIIEMLYADFGYPDEIQELVRYIPLPQGEPAGAEVIQERWRAYVELKLADYLRRDWQTRS